MDDILIAAPTTDARREVANLIYGEFNAKDLGLLAHYCGIRVEWASDGSILLSQEAYIDVVLQRFQMDNYTPSAVPFQQGTVSDVNTASHTFGKPSATNTDQVTRYAELCGCLMWLYIATRPDLGFTATYNARFAAKPTVAHWRRLRGTLRYLQGTRGRGLRYTPRGTPLTGFGNSSYTDDITQRRSSQGYLFLLASAPIAWCASLQTLVTLPTFEAAYVALMHATREIVYLIQLLRNLNHEP